MQHEKTINAQIEAAKKNQYDIKFSLWELKNEIMNLNALYLEQQEEYERLYQEVGYLEEQPDPEDPDNPNEDPLAQL